MPGPKKLDYSDEVGEYTQTNYEFLMTKLWGSTGRQVRDQFIAAPNQAALQALLTEYKIPFDPNVRIAVVDLETARTNGLSETKANAPAVPATDDFYTLVLPPAPRRHPQEPHYREMQGWTSAHYHAINDSYGM